MFIWNLIAGSRVAQFAVVALGAMAFLYGAMKYIDNQAQKKLLLDLKENELEIRERVNDATNTSPDNVGDAIEFLRDRSD